MATGRVPTTANSPLTAKGDLFGYSTTQARVPVGNNGETLVADSSASTGLRYNPLNVLANPIINGGLDIWQRGTSFTISGTNVYTADRWTAGRGGGAAGQTISRQTVSDSTNLPNILYAIRSQRAAGNTATNGLNLVYTMESQNSKPFAGKTISISFYARRGANFSAASNQIAIYLNSGTGTDETVWNGFTGQTGVVAQGMTLTTSWQRFSFAGNVPSNSNQLGFYIEHIPSAGTAGADDWFEVTGFQIDTGTYTASAAPTFRRSGGTLAGELAACQRYYWRLVEFEAYGGSQVNGSANLRFTLTAFNPVPMRTTPTAAFESTPYITDSAGNLRTITAVTTGSKLRVNFAYDSTALTANNSYGLNFSDAGRALSFSSEL